MRSVNKVIIIGNLTRNPEMRQTPNGQSVATFGIATNRQWTTKESEKKNSAEFHECVAWANLAEICAKYLKKGNLVYVEGYLKTRSWDSQEGVKKFKTEIVVQDMIMLEKKKDSEDYIPAEYEEPEDHTAEITEETKKETPVAEEQREPEAPKEEAPASEIPEEKEKPEESKEEESPIEKDLGL